MAKVEDLMGVGVNSEVARRTGWFIQSLSSQESRTIQGPGNQIVIVANASASLILGDKFSPGDEVMVCSRGVAVSLYPASSHYIWPTSLGAVHAVTADVTRTFIKVDASVWQVNTSV